MNKNKRDIILLIVLVFVILSVGAYQLYFQPLMSEVDVASAENDKKTIDNEISFNAKNKALKALETGLTTSKDAAKALSSYTITTIDTPQLINDMYTACKKYGITGEDIIFSLQDATTNPTGSKSSTTGTDSSTSNTTNSADTATPAKGTTATDTTKTSTKVLSKLSINLKVVGDKSKVDLFLKNLSSLTARKLTVISLNLVAVNKASSTTGSASGTTPGITQGTTPGVTQGTTSGVTQGTTSGVTAGTTTPQNAVADAIEAQIIFNQYLITDPSQPQVITPSKYDFYVNGTGYKNFSDMFK